MKHGIQLGAIAAAVAVALTVSGALAQEPSPRQAQKAAPQRAAKSGGKRVRPGGGKQDNSPLARQWRQRLTGKKLTLLHSYSSGSAGGTSSRYDLYLNRDGTFVHRGSTTVAVYVEGASGSSGSREESAGKWRIFTQGSRTILEATPNGQKPEQFELTSAGGKTLLNGTPVFVSDP